VARNDATVARTSTTVSTPPPAEIAPGLDRLVRQEPLQVGGRGGVPPRLACGSILHDGHPVARDARPKAVTQMVPQVASRV